MDESDYISLIFYYGRNKLYHSMQKSAINGVKHSGNVSFRLFNGMALVLGNCVQEGIRELNPLKTMQDVSMASMLCLIHAHKRCVVIDKEAIMYLDGKIKEERKILTANSAYYSSIFLFFTGKIDKAREYVEKALRLNDDFTYAFILKGWIELYLNPSKSKNLFELFEKALSKGKNIDASLGQVKYYQINSDFENAISVLNKLSIRYPELNIPLIEKMETQLASWNWEHAFETCLRIINLERNNVFGLRVKSLLLLCREGNFKLCLQTLQQLFVAIEKVEINNFKFLIHTTQLFSRICERNKDILSLTIKYTEKVVQTSPGNAEFITELGYQKILMGQIKDATKYFRSATKIDDSSIFALCGLTLCQIAENGITDQVRQQIEFLNEIQGINKIPLLLYMSAKICDNSDKALEYLIECCEVHLRNLKGISFGAEYLLRFDPDFMLQVAEEFLNYCPIQYSIQFGQISSKHTLHISLKHSLNILEAVVKVCPGLMRGKYMLAKIQFLCGDITLALNTLHKILNDNDPAYTDAHLLLVQIYIQQRLYQNALQNLEVCLSYNFNVRENPMYHLLNGIVQKNQMKFEDAQKSFQSAMNLINVKNIDTSNISSPTKTGAILEKYSLNLADKVTLYLELIDVFVQLGQNVESEKLMQNAIEQFSNTSEEGRLIIVNSELAARNGNTNRVIELLKTIEPGQPYYLQARIRLAHTYLHQYKDRLAFAQCFKQLVDNCPDEPESYLMLGDAYMSIQEPDFAIDSYKQAILRNPTDSLLASKLGRAYVKTHQYIKAINYYREAIANPDLIGLKLDLAELYLKLKQFSNAEQTLIDEIDIKRMDDNDIAGLQIRTKQLLLLARIREKAGNLNSSLLTLKEAKENQYRVQKRINIDNSSDGQEQHKILSKICVLMAEQSISLRDNYQAVHYFNEALKCSPQDIIIMAALARLFMQMGLMDQCNDICAQILQIDANNETASVMMADLSFRKMDFDNAAYHFSQLLSSKPTYWRALARLIEVMRRSGTLIESNDYLQRAEFLCRNSISDAGFNYCKGLYEWYSGNPNSSLRFFNNARRDSEWGQQSIFNMIEICLNPDGELPTEVTLFDNYEDLELKDSRTMALRTADRLLKELRPRIDGPNNETLNYRLLHNFLKLSSRRKSNVEIALSDFTDIASQDDHKDMVGPILGIASAYVMLKQIQRARNQLKRIVNNNWNFEEAEYLERCWLLLADLYVQSSKYDMAQDILQKVLKHNKSCVKAYELLGFIAEKEQVYRLAAINYDFAWRFSGMSKLQIGYKLAFNYMKTKRYANAIDVCQQVLKIHPDYLSIKKDVLDKCRNILRS